MSSRRPFHFAVAVLVLLLAADTVAWEVATARLRSAFMVWQGSLAAKGWQVSSETPAATGWPFAARLRLRQARLGQADAAGFAWSAASVEFGVSLLHPKTLVVSPADVQSLAGPGLPAIRFHADDLTASAPLGGGITAARAQASRLTVETPVGDAVATAVRINVVWTRGAVHVQATAGPIAMPPRRRWGLGQTVTTASIDLIAHGAWPASGGREAAAAWRDAGGSLDVAHLAGQWGTLDVRGSGRATLDADLQPRAQLALTVIDPQAAIAMLGDTGAISRGAATAAGAVLGLMALPARLAGQPATLDLPLRVEGGLVLAGQIPIARLPRVQWP